MLFGILLVCFVAIRVVDDNGQSKVEWESEFEAAGAPDGDAMEVIQGIYQAGFDNLKKMFGGQ